MKSEHSATGSAPKPRRKPRAALCGLLFTAVGWVAAQTPNALVPSVDWIQPAELEAAGIALEMSRSGRVTHVSAAILIDADPEQIWDILIACEIAPEYVPNVLSCRSLELLGNGTAELFVQTVKPAFFIPAFEHVFRMDFSPYEEIVISRVSGPIRHLDSRWQLRRRDDGRTQLNYLLSLDPGLPVPRLFVRSTLRRDLPKVLSAVRERAEAQ